MTSLGLPDPDYHADFYSDVPTKRAVAWGIDAVIIALMSLALMPLTLFTALFYFPLFFFCVGFAYRTVTIARRSATWGMRVMSVELRSAEGKPFGLPQAFLHTSGYTISLAFFPLQFVSVVLMLTTARGQGLTDLVLGSAMINRAQTA